MDDETLTENGRLMCLLAALIIAGERANPTMVNPSLAYTYNPQGALNAAGDLVRHAMQVPEFRRKA